MTGDDRLEMVRNLMMTRLSAAWFVRPSPRAQMVCAEYDWGNGTSDSVFATASGYAYGRRSTPAGRAVLAIDGPVTRVIEVVNHWSAPY